jgi:thimet oligopeptidase
MNKLPLFLSSLILCAIFANSYSAKNVSMKNPLIPEFNKEVDFKSVKTSDIDDVSQWVIKQTKLNLEKIYAVAPAKRTFNNTMVVFDDMMDRLNSVVSTIYLLGFVHPDSTLLSEAQKSVAELSKYMNEVFLDEKLYKAVSDYAQSPESKGLEGYKKKFVHDVVRSFEKNGFSLPIEKRDELKKIQNKLADIGINFSTNISGYSDFLIVNEKEVQGLPDDYKQQRKQEDGTYKIDLSYPSYIPFMKYSQSADARKTLQFKFLNRATNSNLTVLDSMLFERKAMSTLLGYPTFAAYQVADRMVKKTSVVWDFEKNLLSEVRAKAQKDYQELLEEKKLKTGDPSVTSLDNWETSYYTNLLLLDKYQLDNQKLKEYFEIDNVIKGLFHIAGVLYDIQFVEVKDPSVWQEDVKMFNVMQAGKLTGRMYLDLYPRPNKYGHAACFSMNSGKTTAEGFQYPIASLVCNFPKPSIDKPALISHEDVVTFFHEFGHLLHHLLSKADLSSQAGLSVANDFVEVPSQFFEHWAWNYDALKLFARHYKTGEVLPQALFEKMVAARNVGSGIAALQQIFYGMYDFTLHDQYEPLSGKSTTDVLREQQNAITLYPYLEGTHMQASFDHLNGYGAGYYGYLWSKVYAEDMFSEFEKNGILDKATGQKFMHKVLAKGATQDELSLVKDFLGREPNNKAFLKSLGL